MQDHLSLGYNERLFNKKTLRGKLHYARYFWLQQQTDRLGLRNITAAELGCFDGKAINFLHQPAAYDGFDINWEDGLTIARKNWKDYPQYQFYECAKPEQFNPAKKVYDITICQETLEHIHTADLDGYIGQLAAATGQYSFITVPNEKGLFLLLKYVAKRLMGRRDEPYALAELWYATIGRMDKVPRTEGDHKGFDYDVLIKNLSVYFEVQRITGLPVRWMPRWLSFTIALVLKPKTSGK